MTLLCHSVAFEDADLAPSHILPWGLQEFRPLLIVALVCLMAVVWLRWGPGVRNAHSRLKILLERTLSLVVPGLPLVLLYKLVEGFYFAAETTSYVGSGPAAQIMLGTTFLGAGVVTLPVLAVLWLAPSEVLLPESIRSLCVIALATTMALLGLATVLGAFRFIWS